MVLAPGEEFEGAEMPFQFEAQPGQWRSDGAWPSTLFPQHSTKPAWLIAQVWAAPALTLTKLFPPPGAGARDGGACPKRLSPQQSSTGGINSKLKKVAVNPAGVQLSGAQLPEGAGLDRRRLTGDITSPAFCRILVGGRA